MRPRSVLVATLPFTFMTMPACGPEPAPASVPAVPDRSPPVVTHPDAGDAGDVGAVVGGINEFAWALYHRTLPADGGNLFACPASVSIALAMTLAGAEGQTARAMATTLRFGLPEQRLHPAFAALLDSLADQDQSVRLDIANRLWGQRDYEFQPGFLATCEREYGGGFQMLDFVRDPGAARAHINDWVGDRTQEKIPELLPDGSINMDTRLVLTNAVYFKAAWKQPFDTGFTVARPFHIPGAAPIETDMMNRTGSFPYYADDRIQVLEMPYGGDRLSMVIMLPAARDGLAGLERRLGATQVQEWLDALRPTEVSVALPKFTHRSPVSLKQVLIDMGMSAAFTADAEFGRMVAPPNRVCIDDVVHEAFVDVSEEGTEAAAATAVTMRMLTTSVNQRPRAFIADHPFVYAIRDRDTGLILFTGRLVDPR